MKNINEKIKKTWRKLQRGFWGESNRVQLVPEDYIPLKWIPSYARFYRHVASSPTLENRLQFAANRPLLEGDDNDIHQIRCLDHVIGKLTQSFNGAAGIPEKTLAKIYGHINDVSSSLLRVSAYMAIGDKMVPVKQLEYGGKDGQPVIKIKLG
ncbi:MAG: hypothetical protein K8R48_09910 [Alphaproteobacteria bacterium]|nr:hypothetical protein [Alphaproteobacteria bacterium]